MFLNPVLPSTSPYYTSRLTGNVNRATAVQSAVEDTLDLSAAGRNVLETLGELSPAERSEYLENLARLLQAGVVGTELLDVDKRPYASFASTRAADARLKGARLYRA